MNAWGKIIEILVTAILLFLIPLYFMACKADCVEHCFVQNESVYLVDCIRNTGFLSRQMYETFEKKLYSLGTHYEIELTCYEKRQGVGSAKTIYVARSKDEVLQELFTGEQKVFWKQGDFINIKVTGENNRIMSGLFRVLVGRNMELQGNYIVYGGAVRDDTF